MAALIVGIILIMVAILVVTILTHVIVMVDLFLQVVLFSIELVLFTSSYVAAICFCVGLLLSSNSGSFAFKTSVVSSEIAFVSVDFVI